MSASIGNSERYCEKERSGLVGRAESDELTQYQSNLARFDFGEHFGWSILAGAHFAKEFLWHYLSFFKRKFS